MRICTTTLRKYIDGKMLTKRSLSLSLKADKVESCRQDNINSGLKNKKEKERKTKVTPLSKRLSS